MQQGSLIPEGCQSAVALYQDALLTAKPWALQMLDASSSFPDGLLSDGGPRLGHFDECVSASAASPFPTKYCLVKYTSAIAAPSIATPLRLLLHGADAAMTYSSSAPVVAVDLAVCVPAACNATEAVAVAAHNLQPHLSWLGGSIQSADNCFEEIPLDAAAVAFFVVAALLVAAALAASLQTQFVPWMSARHNFLALFASAAPSTIHCVHGIRFLSMAWVMFGHKFYYSTFLAPPPAMAASKMPWTSGVLLNTYLSVDTFLLISALLSARAIARAGTLNVPLFYALRCARIWPPLAAVVFFTTCASAVVGSGPLWWPLVVSEAGFCQKRWWTALIFLNNYIDNGNSCFSSSWFLSVDMQLAWLSPLVLIPLLRWRKSGVATALILLLITTAAIFTITFLFDFPWTLSLVSDLDKIALFWKTIYTNSPMRAQPYLIGLLLGFFLECPRKKAPSKWFVLLAWVISLGLMAFVLFGLMLSHTEAIRDVTWAAALYGSTHRLVWSLGLAWIIYACHKGFGGFINYILSLRIWVPLSRLTFCLFLTHLSLITISTGARRSHTQFSIDGLIHSYIGDVVFALLPALALHLTVEAPVNGFIKSMMIKQHLRIDLNKS